MKHCWKHRVLFAVLIPALIVVQAPATLCAQQPPADESTLAKRLADLEAKFHFQQGTVELPGGIAKLTVPDTFRYLGPKDTELLLTEGWGNPDGSGTLGMIVPAKGSPLSDDSWGVIINFDEDGYVDDADAASIDYKEMLAEMKSDTEAANEERVKAGFEKVHLVGWAATPHYDKAAHKLYWAKELRFEGNEENTLNYNIRVLGRRGVLILNAVAAKSQLAAVEKDMPTVMSFVEFQQGHRYSDYIQGTDKLAAYGLGALVAGKVIAKVGFFKMILVALLAAKKFVFVAIAAIGSFLMKLFKGRKQKDTGEPVSDPQQAGAAGERA